MAKTPNSQIGNDKSILLSEYMRLDTEIPLEIDMLQAHVDHMPGSKLYINTINKLNKKAGLPPTEEKQGDYTPEIIRDTINIIGNILKKLGEMQAIIIQLSDVDFVDLLDKNINKFRLVLRNLQRDDGLTKTINFQKIIEAAESLRLDRKMFNVPKNNRNNSGFHGVIR